MASTSNRKRPSLRDEQRTFTRTRLLESAAHIISQVGLTNATVADIADNANASRATFYLHFKDKDDLLAALIEHVQPDVAAYYSRLDDLIAGDDRDGFRRWVVDALRWFSEHETVVLALQQAMLSRYSPATFAAASFTAHMPQYLAAWPPGTGQQAELRVWLIVQQLSRVSLLRRDSGGKFSELSDEEIVDVLVDTMQATLRLDQLQRDRF